MSDKDWTLEEWNRQASRLIGLGGQVWAKFTCDGCGSRQTDEKPNQVCTGGYSCEACGHMSFPTKFGMRLVLVVGGHHASTRKPDPC